MMCRKNGLLSYETIFLMYRNLIAYSSFCIITTLDISQKALGISGRGVIGVWKDTDRDEIELMMEESNKQVRKQPFL